MWIWKSKSACSQWQKVSMWTFIWNVKGLSIFVNGLTCHMESRADQLEYCLQFWSRNNGMCLRLQRIFTSIIFRMDLHSYENRFEKLDLSSLVEEVKEKADCGFIMLWNIRTALSARNMFLISEVAKMCAHRFKAVGSWGHLAKRLVGLSSQGRWLKLITW